MAPEKRRIEIMIGAKSKEGAPGSQSELGWCKHIPSICPQRLFMNIHNKYAQIPNSPC